MTSGSLLDLASFFTQVPRDSVADPTARLGGLKKHQIYLATFGSHLFCELFFTGGEAWPLGPLPDSLLGLNETTHASFDFEHSTVSMT